MLALWIPVNHLSVCKGYCEIALNYNCRKTQIHEEIKIDHCGQCSIGHSEKQPQIPAMPMTTAHTQPFHVIPYQVLQSISADATPTNGAVCVILAPFGQALFMKKMRTTCLYNNFISTQTICAYHTCHWKTILGVGKFWRVGQHTRKLLHCKTASTTLQRLSSDELCHSGTSGTLDQEVYKMQSV